MLTNRGVVNNYIKGAKDKVNTTKLNTLTLIFLSYLFLVLLKINCFFGTVTNGLYMNLIPVAIGNIIGGALVGILFKVTSTKGKTEDAEDIE